MRKKKGAQGFASMNPDRQREIASKGGKSAHAKGRAHEWTKEEAREAGRKGGVESGRLQKERRRVRSLLLHAPLNTPTGFEEL